MTDYLSLGFRTERPEIVVGRAALDITTGYGVESYFRTTTRDPWARECVERSCDVLIHHAAVVYPVPDDETLREEELELEVPAVFRDLAGGTKAMLVPLQYRTAEDADLSDDELNWLWRGFAEWVRQSANAAALREWFRLHDSARIALTRRRHSSKRYIDGIWTQLDTRPTVEFAGASDDEMRYAFDTYARTVRYHRILGHDTIYFPHPLRRRARQRDEYTFDGMTWSWGRFLANARESDAALRDSKWLIDHVGAIRDAAARAGVQDHWYSVARRSGAEQRDIIRSIASDARLPAKLTVSAQRDAGLLVQGPAAVASLGAPLVSLAVGLTAVLLGGKLDGTLPPRVSGWRFIQGHLEWPALFGPAPRTF